MTTQKSHLIVGLSGGVDSAVSAYLLKEQGYQLSAVFMKNWEEDDDEAYCSAAVDLEDAEQVARQLGVPLITRNFSAEYWERVFSYFLQEYRQGRTPNPDVLCNKEIKFKTFLDQALDLGADGIATGHYARVELREHYFRLLKGKDKNKDQSYFLHQLSQAQLSRSRFPLGELEKDKVRQLAKVAGFDNYNKKDSTGICFIGERKFKDFLQRFLPAQPGLMQTPEGETIGEHDGLMYYTLGQRQGLKIGGTQQGSGEPWYVVDKRLEDNVLVVAQGHNHPLLFSNRLSASQINWITAPPADLPFRCRAKTRYRQADQDCTITALDAEHCEVHFDQAQRAITPGQFVVFYQDDECLGGGIINHRHQL